MKQQRFVQQSGFAALMVVLGLSSLTPFLAPQPATAQLFLAQNNRLRVTEGTQIKTTYGKAKRIIIKPDETLRIGLETTQAVRSANGKIVIPRGSMIKGQLEPKRGGTQFIADSVTLRNGERFDINATSKIITRTEVVDQGRRTDPIWQGALVGGAATAVISEIFGEAGIFKVLAGSGAGALGGFLLGGRDKAEVRVIDPKTDLDLRLQSDLFLN
jgi:hypothetical protein